MFKPGDKIRHRRFPDITYTVYECEFDNWRTVSGSWLSVASYELAEPTITVTHLRTICDQLRSVAAPQGRFWIREVFEKATGEKME
jgi:hypothetical protein